MFQIAEQEFGGIDIVCPGAGVYKLSWSNFWHPPSASPASKDKPDAGCYAMMDISLSHPIRTTQLAIANFLNPKSRPKASPANQKRVLHISSIASQLPNFAVPIYVATKHGINGLVRSLALTETLGIRVNAVAPGVIKTPIWTDHPEKLKYFNEEKDDWAMPEGVAEAMLRLLEDPSMVGGTILEVGHRQTRRVEARNDPSPSRSSSICSNIDMGYAEVFDWLADKKRWWKAKM